MRQISLILLSMISLLLISQVSWSAPLAQGNTQEIRVGVILLRESPADLALQIAIEELNLLGLTDDLQRPYHFSLVYPPDYPTRAEDVPLTLSYLQNQAVHIIIGPTSADLALPNLEPLARAGVPVLTLTTADPLTDFDVTNNILRLRAPESYYSFAAADYMLNDLALTRVALIQTDISSTEALVAYEIGLVNAGLEPALKIQLEDGSQLAENIPTLLAAQPEAIAMWGAASDAASLYRELKARGWTGVFFYRYAQEAVFNSVWAGTDLEGVLGAAGWSYGTPNAISRTFLLKYVTRYGELPPDEAAAAYDAVYIFAAQVQQVGYEMPVLYETFLDLSPVLGLQGLLDAPTYANGDFSRAVTIYSLNRFGAPQVVARYDNATRILDDDTQDLTLIAAIGTPTFTPSPSPSPTTTLPPSPTPSQPQLTATVPEVNVYAGSGVFFEVLGTLAQNSIATIIGGNADLTWLVIQYRGGIGWVENDPAAITVFDPGGLLNQLPIIDAPPTPIGGASPTPAVQFGDIIIDDVVLTPAKPIPGQSFIASVVLRNSGLSPTGLFSIATTFEPGAVYSSNFVPNIDPNSTITIPLSATLTGSGTFTADIIADVNNEVEEGQGEFNNAYRLTYTIDFPIVNEAVNLTMPAGASADLDGGVGDVSWTGSSFEVVNGAQMGVVTGVIYENVNYTVLSSGVVSSTAPLTDAQLFPGVLIGVRTVEGRLGIIRIEARQGTNLIISYRVYGS